MYMAKETKHFMGNKQPRFESWPLDTSTKYLWLTGFPGGSYGKESTCNAGDPVLIPGSGRFPGEGKGNPLQYSCLGNPMDTGAWQVTVHGVTRVEHDLVTKPPPPEIHIYAI